MLSTALKCHSNIPPPADRTEQKDVSITPWLRLASSQVSVVELQQLVAGVATSAYRRGYASSMTSCVLNAAFPPRRLLAHRAAEEVKIVSEKQIAILEAALQRIDANTDVDGAVLLYIQLLSLVRRQMAYEGTSLGGDGDKYVFINTQMKQLFPMFSCVNEMQHAAIRSRFTSCTGAK